MTARTRLLIVSDSPAIASGQGRVVRELAGRFAMANVDVLVAGWFHELAMPREFVYPVVPVPKTDPSALRGVLDAFEPQTVLCIGDPWDFAWLAQQRAQGAPWRLAGYLNIEAAPITPPVEMILDAFDVLTTTSEFGAVVVGRPYVSAVHHGVDTTTFFPAARPAKIFGREADRTFVVLLNAQNTERKRLDVALAGFAKFAAGKPNVLCFANTVPNPRVGAHPPGFNLADQVTELCIQDLVYFHPDNRGPLRTIDDEALRGIYAISDVLLVTSAAEGFGLTLLEAMATQTVPVAPDAYSASELLADGRGILMPVRAHIKGNTGTNLAVVGEDDVAAALQTAYMAWMTKSLWPYHDAGRRFVMSHGWERTFEGLLDALATEGPARVANGQPIDPYLRRRARAIRARVPEAVAVLKMGGLGDMLQTTTVVRAAWRKWSRPIVVFCNTHPDVFRAMPEVAEVYHLKPAHQAVVARSIGDVFDIFLDVRYVSRAYGAAAAGYAESWYCMETARWFYEQWPESNARLTDLPWHTTELMLRSLGLMAHAEADIRPIFTPRAAQAAVAPHRPADLEYVCIATGVGPIGELKQLPAEWLDALAVTAEEAGVVLVQIGGETDPPVPGATDSRGLPLDVTATLLAGASGLVAVEGGMVHLAAAVGTPTNVFFGPTAPTSFKYPGHRAFRAVNPSGRLRCTPCFWGPGWLHQVCTRGSRHCMNLDIPADVFAFAVDPVLAGGRVDNPQVPA